MANKKFNSVRLECRTGRSNKVYNVSVSPNGDGTYRLETSYGPIGKALRYNPHIGHNNILSATYAAEDIIRKKKAKGYVEVLNTSVEDLYTPTQIKVLKDTAAKLCAEGLFKRSQYSSLKNMLDSGDEQSQVLADEMIQAKHTKLEV